MLTDIIVAEHQPEGGKRKQRYLISADRDEHIRVSRGPPQSYVIESFLLGHKEFVNRLCLVSPEVLVSGGGDDDLYVWDWRSEVQISQVSLRKAVNEVTGFDGPVAVTGLWRHQNSQQEVKPPDICR
jgi:tRNA (guanine-N(7)-)-methyltransferase subunit TRM82